MNDWVADPQIEAEFFIKKNLVPFIETEILRALRSLKYRPGLDTGDFLFVGGLMKTLLVMFLLVTLGGQVNAEENWTDEEIVEAIYLAEGGEKARKPFGILSVKCSGYLECKSVCLRTVRNNKTRFKKYGRKHFATYLEFLASRYAPIGAGNDPKNLNKNWLKNVKYYLAKNRSK